jgi:hypothetical protein
MDSTKTPPARPACPATDCCLGTNKDKAAPTAPNGNEQCAVKTATKATVVTTAASAKATACYIEVTKAVTTEWEGACIEGAQRLVSGAALLAAAYMMA